MCRSLGIDSLIYQILCCYYELSHYEDFLAAPILLSALSLNHKPTRDFVHEIKTHSDAILDLVNIE